jgi:hypothetical protein
VCVADLCRPRGDVQLRTRGFDPGLVHVDGRRALAVARLLDLSETLKWHLDGDIGSLPLPGRDSRSIVSDSLSDGIVGVKGRVNFGAERSWSAPYYLDIGTGSSDLTMLAMAGVGHAFHWGELTGVWRYLDYDLGSDFPIQSLTLSGPAIGATFRF